MTRTISVAPSRLDRWLDGFGERHGAVRYDVTPTSVTLSAEDGSTAVVTVPFEPLAVLSREGLVAHVLTERRLGVLLVRRGGFGAGVFAGGKLLDSKVGSRHVQGTTKAGGWSQQRYARRRGNQADAATDKATDIAVRVLLPHVPGV